MNQVPAGLRGPTITEYFRQIGNFGPIFVIVGIVMASWLIYLTFQPRPLSDYFACLVAAFYPACLGFLGASLSAVQIFYELGDNGTANTNPSALASAIGQTLLCLIVGTGMTCFFVLLALLVLLVRRPRQV